MVENSINDNDNLNSSYVTVILMTMAMFTRLIQLVVDNYDELFKVLSIISLVLICIVNLGKVVEQVAISFKKTVDIVKKISGGNKNGY